MGESGAHVNGLEQPKAWRRPALGAGVSPSCACANAGSTNPSEGDRTMSFRFMAACRKRADDKDKYEKYLRMARATHFIGLFASLWWIFESTWHAAYLGRPFDESAVHVLLFFGALFVFLVSWNTGEAFFEPLRRPHAIPFLVVFLLVAGEAATRFAGWDLGALLVWWRISLVVAAGASLLLWASENRVQSLRLNKKRGSGMSLSCWFVLPPTRKP